jgi:hypothetical protein
MASSGILQAALGIERLPYGLGRWQVVFRPIEGEDRQTLPQILLAGRKHLIRQGDGLGEQCFKGLPGKLGARLGQRAPVWALPLWPQATPTSQGEELAEFGRHAFVPATGDQRNEDNDKLCQRELSAAGEVLGAFLGDRLNEVEEKYEQALIKIDRGRRFLGSSCLSWFNCQYMKALRLYALIRLCLKSTALIPSLPPPVYLMVPVFPVLSSRASYVIRGYALW